MLEYYLQDGWKVTRQMLHVIILTTKFQSKTIVLGETSLNRIACVQFFLMVNGFYCLWFVIQHFKKWPLAWPIRSEPKLLHVMKCGIPLLKCSDGGVHWRVWVCNTSENIKKLSCKIDDQRICRWQMNEQCLLSNCLSTSWMPDKATKCRKCLIKACKNQSFEQLMKTDWLRNYT